MARRYKSHFIILGIIASLLFCGDVRAEEGPPSDHATTQGIVAGPEPHAIKLVSFDPLVIEGELMGAVATYVYDDVATERPADYWEIYNQKGELLAVSWFDGRPSTAPSSKRKTSSREFLLSSSTATRRDEIGAVSFDSETNAPWNT